MATHIKKYKNLVQLASPVARKLLPSTDSLRRFKKSNDGVAAIEFAFLGSVFLMLFLAITDLSIFYFMNRSAEAGAEMLARRIKTNLISQNIGMPGLRQELCNISVMKVFNCENVLIDVETKTAFEAPQAPEYDENGSLNSDGFTADIGPPASINIVRVFVRWNSFQTWVAPQALVDGRHAIQVTTAFRKE